MPYAKKPMESVTDVSLPHSLEAEEAIIGGILVHARKLADVKPMLIPLNFWHPTLGAVYEAMLELDAAASPLDPVSVVEQMRALGTFDKLRSSGGADYLTDLTAKVVTVENLGHLARIVRKKATARRAFDIADELRRAALADEDGEGLVEVFSARLAALATSPASTSTAFPTLQIADVPDLGPVRYLVQDLWADEACGFVGGKPKRGKSWLALEIGVCVASGQKVLGKFVTDPGRVLFYNSEDKPGRSKERARMLCRAKGLDLAAIDFRLLDVPTFALDDDKQVARMRATIAETKPKLVILDPLRRLHRLDEDKAGDMDPLLDELRKWQREYGCSVMVVHHVTKADGDASGQSLRGSSVFHAWLDSALYVTSKGKAWDEPRKVDVEHRDSENVDPFEWRLQKATAVDGETAWLELDAGDATNDEAAADEVTVISILQAATEPMTSTQITKAAKKRNGWSAEPIRRLVEAGTVVPIESGRYITFRLKS